METRVNASDEDPVAVLGALLAAVNATPALDRARIVHPTLHDADYHIAMIACAMAVYAARSPTRRVLAPWLKLLQFVAARPALVDNLLEYARARRGDDLEKWALMPRGYMGDTTHDRAVDYLVAAQMLRREGDWLEAGSRVEALDAIVAYVERRSLFQAERRIFERLGEIRPTKTMLGGA